MSAPGKGRRAALFAGIVALVAAGGAALLFTDRERLSERLVGGDEGVALVIAGVGLLWLVSLAVLASVWRAAGRGE